MHKESASNHAWRFAELVASFYSIRKERDHLVIICRHYLRIPRVTAIIFWCKFFAPWFFHANAYFRWPLASIGMKRLRYNLLANKCDWKKRSKPRFKNLFAQIWPCVIVWSGIKILFLLSRDNYCTITRKREKKENESFDAGADIVCSKYLKDCFVI